MVANSPTFTPPTKTASSQRRIALDPGTVEMLRPGRQLDQRLEAGELWSDDYGPVFTGEIGRHIPPIATPGPSSLRLADSDYRLSVATGCGIHWRPLHSLMVSRRRSLLSDSDIRRWRRLWIATPMILKSRTGRLRCRWRPRSPADRRPFGRIRPHRARWSGTPTARNRWGAGCRREDSNFHGISPTWPSTMRVYQFRHSDVG